MPLEPGQDLLHYRIVEKIGEGGMGVVWKARDSSLDREVAIKLLPPELGHERERFDRFEREARAVSRLAHPNVLHVTDFGTAQGGIPFLVMELIEGDELSSHVGRAVSPAEVVGAAARILGVDR